MELRDLRAFLAVAEELHFGRAAQRLHIAQPPLSQRIRALERELGATLLTRTSRTVKLTAAGAEFLDRCREILGRVDEAAARTRRAAQGRTGRLAVGFVNPAMDGFLSGAVNVLRRERPEVELSLREMATVDQVEALRTGALDLGFLRLAGQPLNGLEVTVVSRQAYVAVLPQGHRLAGRKAVPLAELGREPLILYPRRVGPELYDAMMAAFGRAGVIPEIAQEALSKFTTMSLAASGLGVALVPTSAAVWRRRGVVFRPVDGALPEVVIGAACPAGGDAPAARRLVELCRRQAENGSAG